MSVNSGNDNHHANDKAAATLLTKEGAVERLYQMTFAILRTSVPSREFESVSSNGYRLR